MKQSAKGKPLPSYQKLVKGYLGFLTGTGKSLSTISSYKGDLGLLEAYLGAKKKDFYSLSQKDFALYQIWLEKQGLKINTRRRKILCAKSLVKYAVSRKKISPSSIQFVKAPERLERLPWIPKPEDWAVVKEKIEPKSKLGLRNALAVLLLAETGLNAAELVDLRWEQVQGDSLALEGKKPRRLELSGQAQKWIAEWKEANAGRYIFPGFNRHGVTSERMTTRGLELYFRRLARETGFRLLKPKTLRHFAVATWLRERVADTEIHRRLGVHPNYSLDAYRKHIETA